MSADPRRLSAITFDFWNTLIAEDPDPLGLRFRRVEAALVTAGFTVDSDRFAAALDAGEEVYARRWAANEPFTPEEWAAVVSREAGFDDDAALSAIVEELRLGVPASRRTPAPYLDEVLPALSDAGVRIGIVCDVGLTPSSRLRQYLEHFDLLQWFDHWSFSDEVGCYKPHAEIFEHALAGLGVDAAEAAHIGDLKRTDVAGAQAMGIHSVRYALWRDDEGEGPEAETIIDDHRRLLELAGL